MTRTLFRAVSALFLTSIVAACNGNDGTALLNTSDPGAPIATLTIIGSGSVPSGGSGSYTLQLLASSGKAVTSTPVTLTTSLGTLSLASTTASLTTDINGEIAFVLTAAEVNNGTGASIPVTGAALLSASAEVSGSKISATDTVQFNPTAFDFLSPAANSILQANVRQTLTFGWTSSGLAVDAPVLFATDTGVLIDANGDSASSLSVETSNGVASIDLLVSTSGAVNVTAASGVSAGNLTATLPLTFAAAAATATISAATPILSDGSSLISVVVLDAGGNPVPGQTVAFALLSSPGGALAVLSALTDGTGTATTVYDANGFAGTASVQITVVPLAPATVAISIT